MALYKSIFVLIFIVQFVAISSAARDRSRIVPVGTIRVLQSYRRRFIAGIAGTCISIITDHVALEKSVLLPTHPKGDIISHEETFRTQGNEIIIQVRISDVTERPSPGGHIELINNGPGSRSVTLKFFSTPNSGIHKTVWLYGHD